MNPVKRYLTIILLAMAANVYGSDTNIEKYGAVGDGNTLNSAAIQQAIDHCAQTGGGKVIFPAGRFVSGTISLKNNMTLRLEKGAVLLGSTNINDYQNLDPFTEGLGIHVGWALVVGVDLQNIGIEGEGTIDGRGSELKAQQILTDSRPEGQRWGRRPFLLRLVRCNQVHIQGVTLNYSAAWTSHYYHCKQVTIEHIKIVSRGVAHNDGIDIDGCQNVNISDSDIDSGDDALCFKTTSSEMPCSGIRVRGLKLKSGQGAIKMGTESMAAFQDIKISDCYIYNTNNGGIKLLTVDGAHLNNVEISDITMVNVKTPILIRLGSRLSVFRKDQDKQQPTGTLENIIIRNIKARAADTAQLKPPSGILITGVPGHPIKNLRLENIEIDLAGGGTVADSKQEVPEAIDKYPEVKTFGPLIPAYGIWARHVEGLQLVNIRFNLKNNEERPAIICDDAEKINITNCIFPPTTGSLAVIQLKQADNIIINDNKVEGMAGAFIGIDNAKSKVSYKGNKTPAALTMINTGRE